MSKRLTHAALYKTRRRAMPYWTRSSQVCFFYISLACMPSVPELFEQFNKINVLVVGDVMIDRYLTGSVDRISPEAPVPIVSLKRAEDRLGGAANVALNLSALGATPYLCSAIGDDAAADVFMRLLPEAALPLAGIVRMAGRVTTVKTRVMAGPQHLLRIDEEEARYLWPSEEEKLWQKVSELLETKNIGAILFQDYNKGVLTPGLIGRIIEAGQKKGIPITVDPKDRHFWAYRGVTLFKPNLKEIQHQVDFSLEPRLASLTEADRYIRERLGNTYTMITLSDKGIFLSAAVGEAQVYPTQPRQIVDVCGAGDTVIGVATLALASGLPPEQLALLSNLAGGQVCERVGVAPVNKAQLQAEYTEMEKKEKGNTADATEY